MSPIPPMSTSSAAQPDDRQDTVSVGSIANELVSRPIWVKVLFLASRFPLGLLWFLVIVVGASVGLGTAIIGIGLAVLAGMFHVLRGGARLERELIKLAGGPHIADPYRVVPDAGARKRWGQRLTDPATYRDVLYLLLQFPLGLASFIGLVTSFSLTFGAIAVPLFYNRMGDARLSLFATSNGAWFVVDRLWKALLVGLIGLLLLPLLPLVIRAMSRMHFFLATLLLGATRREEVAEAIEQRDLGLSADMTERKRIERDLHDGAQQRLVAMTMELGRARAKLAEDPEAAKDLLDSAHEHAKAAMQELRDLARGIAPPLLADRGLDPALSALAARSPIPVDLSVTLNRRLPESIESTAYFVIAEASTNAIKHSGATLITVRVMDHGNRLAISVSDNGSGGVDSGGSGIVGLADRVRSVGGHFMAHNGEVSGVSVMAEIPCES